MCCSSVVFPFCILLQTLPTSYKTKDVVSAFFKEVGKTFWRWCENLARDEIRFDEVVINQLRPELRERAGAVLARRNRRREEWTNCFSSSGTWFQQLPSDPAPGVNDAARSDVLNEPGWSAETQTATPADAGVSGGDHAVAASVPVVPDPFERSRTPTLSNAVANAEISALKERVAAQAGIIELLRARLRDAGLDDSVP